MRRRSATRSARRFSAWLCGRPVIGARIPAIECVIDHGVDGLLVAPRSVPALADALVELLADPRRRDAMGAAGRAKALARFTWDRVTDRVEAVYRTTLAQGRRSIPRAG
jgi:glycosyltransferase involved in cell wall biosynthesis